MYMSQVERNERLAVGISDIPSTVPLDVLARLPFDDQPDSEIDATLYQEKGQSYYSIFVAVTRLGLLKRALDFVQQHGGRPSLHPVCIFREAKRGRDVRLPRQFVPEMLDLLEPSKFKLKASEIPFNLAVMAFLTDQHKTYAHQQEEYGSALDESDQLVRLPLTQAQKKAKAAAREVDRLEKIARQAVFHKQELEQRQQDIQTARQGAPPPTDEEAIYEFSRYSEIEAATRKAYLDILAFERAREKAELAHEIVLLQHEFQHDDHGDFFIQHTMIYPPDEEERECTLHITDVLTEEGFHRDHYSITYHSDEDEDRYLQLIFSLTSDYFRTQSLELTFKTHRLELASSVAPLPDQMTVVGMKMSGVWISSC
ncbi:hypothetical protein [Sporisorium scitamineum]|uniref:Uncharacterized protein n=1 Tax=Sporisorium scitamineum TaxID=49012 RepID=A0A0F7S1C0_9BASI|nr:hypothetical protein [Sporisorium scitamineum]